MTFYVIGFIFIKIFRFPKITSNSNNKDWVIMNHHNIVYNESFKELKLNEKIYRFSQVVSLDIFVNSKKVEKDDLKNNKNIKTLEIKIGLKVNKITYKKFKYITNKDSGKEKKKQLKLAIVDYEKLSKLVKIKNKKVKKNNNDIQKSKFKFPKLIVDRKSN